MIRRVGLLLSAIGLATVGFAAPAYAGKPPPSTMSFTSSSGSATEGTSLTVTVARSSTKGKASVVVTPVATTTGTDASIGTDVSSTPQTATFAAGSSQAQVSFAITDDTDYDPNETFGLHLSSPTKGYAITGGDYTATITDNDQPPAVPHVFTLGPGDSASFSSLSFGGCNRLAAALEVVGGTTTQFVSKDFGCGSPIVGGAPPTLLNSTGTPFDFRIDLTDSTLCTGGAITYRSDSTSSNGVNHARVTQTSAENFDVGLTDAGGDCQFAATDNIPNVGVVFIHVAVTSGG